MVLSVRYERDGLVMPRAIGGHAALDLVNTFAGWDRPSETSAREYLQSYDHLVLWAASVGVVADADVTRLRRAGDRDPEAADGVVHRARQLRSSVRELLLDQGGTGATGALATVHDLAGRAVAAARLRWEPPLTLEFAGGVEAPLDKVAWHCLLFLTTPDVARVRACPGRDCGWLFLDTTGRRRWCRMEWCGNRAKARAHARRHREVT